MFKKLRNRLLIINTLIIAALVLGSFSVIYLMTARNINNGINEKLNRAVNFIREEHAPIQKNNPKPPADTVREEPMTGENKPGEGIPEEIIPGGKSSEKQPFSLTFTIFTDLDGTIENINMPFELDEDFYSDKIGEIISASSAEGHIKSETGYWAYRLKPFGTGYAIAFTDIQSEHDMLRNLFLILLLVGLAALTAAFLISLYSANRSIKPIEESYNKQKQFVADASHELKTPLTTINTNIDVLMSHGESKISDEKKWLDYIKNETERMTKLTNDLLYLARADHDSGQTLFDKASFSDAAESVILTMEAVIFEKNINLGYDIAPDLYVLASAEKLKQLVMILLDNAIKYTPEKGDITICLKIQPKRQNALLSVKNSGAGIGEEDLKHIFERFYRSDKSRARSSGGYGLGLAIAKAIAEETGGTISARSEQGKYTEFTAEIPLAD